ncbi:MAG: hypothetical protein GY841_15905 [FCB group bacterium]|nr:hypothetical protein [FCB group bacterium]
MGLSKARIKGEIAEVLKTGKWMLRRSNNGKSYGGFQWAGLGCWTEAPDWNPEPECGGGLHGCGPASSGFWTSGCSIDFCKIDGEVVEIDGTKLKCHRAMILLRDTLPDNLTVGGGLDLFGTGITELPDNLTVGDWLNLGGTGITELPDNAIINGDIYWQ